ncbi:hypothetical protein FISHEDRAFT_44039 [Fistulina hepatica ATCC 64428]|uniref:Autophagy-related protein 14 n=1 Tax=Fistulina hepatica ATCC 64428 TaxID=1128425 RepID=A0A0D7ACA8_9AGAR|nr:hypothetical protein FISHEDRAFT_44039 [Fistulina hepatica ATCC 64428]
MDCKNCELKQRQFFCENCLSSRIQDIQRETQRVALERDEQVTRATNELRSIEEARRRRATVVKHQNDLDEQWANLATLRSQNAAKRDRVRAMRESLANRRQTLSAAQQLPPLADKYRRMIANEEQELGALAESITRARSGLVQELVEVFNIVQVGGRPPIGGKAGSNGEWIIGDLILPVPGDMRRYPPDHINAVLTHTIHFLSLLTFYLGIKLPFEVTWTGKKLGVGQPMIGAVKGGENGGWARYHVKQSLYLSMSASSGSSKTTAPDNPIQSEASMSDSIASDVVAPTPSSSFMLALSMLLYNVTYLAYTQNVAIPLNQAGDVLNNLWIMCCSADLGTKSHATLPRLPPPTPSSFPLEFTQLMQAASTSPATRVRWKPSNKVGRTGKNSMATVEEEGWDLVDGDDL